MFCQNRILVLTGALFLCLFAASNCNRDLSTEHENKPEEKIKEECIKDGIMTLITATRTRLPDGSKFYTYDTLFVSEIENRLEDIDNGVLFQVPEMWNLEINFFGNFEGMPNKIFYLFRYKRESKRNGIIEEWMAGEVHNKTTGVILTSLGNTAFDIQGILFGLDSDDEHSGLGTVIIEHANVPIDTIIVDAAKNTVVYGAKAAYLPMTLKSSDTGVEVFIFDECSFFDEKVRVVWFVEDMITHYVGYFYVTPVQGQFLPQRYGSHVLLWAFATRFLQLEETNDE